MKIVYLILALSVVVALVYMAKGRDMTKAEIPDAPAQLKSVPPTTYKDPRVVDSYLKVKELETQTNVVKKFSAANGDRYFLTQNVVGRAGSEITTNWLYRLNSDGAVKQIALPEIDRLEGVAFGNMTFDPSLQLVIPVIYKRRALLVSVDEKSGESTVLPIKGNRDVLGVAVKQGKVYIFEVSESGARMFVYQTFDKLTEPVDKYISIESLYEIYDIQIEDEINLVGAFLKGSDIEARLVAIDDDQPTKISNTFIQESNGSSMYELIGRESNGLIRLVAFTRARKGYSIIDVDTASESISANRTFDERLRWFDVLATDSNELFVLEMVKQGKRWVLRMRNIATGKDVPVEIDAGGLVRFYEQVSVLNGKKSDPVVALVYAELSQDNRMTYSMFEIAPLATANN